MRHGRGRMLTAIHNLVVWSIDADASSPGREKARATTASVCPRNVMRCSPVHASHILTALSADPVAMASPAGEYLRTW